MLRTLGRWRQTLAMQIPSYPGVRWLYHERRLSFEAKYFGSSSHQSPGIENDVLEFTTSQLMGRFLHARQEWMRRVH